MIKNSKRSIGAVLNDPQHNLGKIIKKANDIHMLHSKLQNELPEGIAKHTWVGTFQKGILTLLVDSAALATQLRFMVPDIREKLRAQPQWYGLKSIDVKIIVSPPNKIEDDNIEPVITPIIGPITMPKYSSDIMIELANNLDDANGGDKLKAALLRLAKHGKKEC